MKGKLALVVILTLFISTMYPVFAANDQINVSVDGEKLQFDVQPQIIEGRTLVPLREIFEALGSTVNWDAETKTAIGLRGDIKISLPIGKNTALKNGKIIELDVPAQIIDGRTLVPVRFIAESLGAEVDWDGNTSTVIINDIGMGKRQYVEDKTMEVGGELGSYTGYIQNDQPNGEGIIKFNSGNSFKAKEYDGEFRSGKIHGEGNMIYTDGSKYEGEFKDNKKHGTGTMLYRNGDKYEGQWLEDEISGSGMMVWDNGDIYVGEWENGKMNGQGTMTYTNGDKYEGQWADGKKNGEGTMTYANGDKYVGQWKDNFQDGEGTMTYSNGDKYEGDWRYGDRDGQGKLTTADGKVTGGIWQSDKLIKEDITVN